MPKSELSRKDAERLVLAMFCRVAEGLPHCVIGRLASGDPDVSGFVILDQSGNRKVAELRIWMCRTVRHISGLVLVQTTPNWGYEAFSLDNTESSITARESELRIACIRATPDPWLLIDD